MQQNLFVKFIFDYYSNTTTTNNSNTADINITNNNKNNKTNGKNTWETTKWLTTYNRQAERTEVGITIVTIFKLWPVFFFSFFFPLNTSARSNKY